MLPLIFLIPNSNFLIFLYCVAELNSIASCYGDEACDANVNIEETSNGFSLRLQYHSTYFKFIIGKKGETKKRLETETKTRITIPKMGQEGDIGISVIGFS